MNWLKMTRTFDAPREVVFNAWTDGKQMAKWFGPKGFTTEITQHDARPGGQSLIMMRGPDGTEYPGKAIFREILKPQRIVMTSYALKDGREVLETLVTVTLEEKNRMTTLNLVVEIVKATEEAKPYTAGMEEGWKQTLDKLGELVIKSSGR
jgi:uncharacterized protein YndB with AHSA1/START domain